MAPTQTSAQARLERRLAWQSPAVGVVLGASLLAGSHPAVVLVVVVVTQALLVSGLHRGLHVSAPVSGMVVAGLLAGVTDVVVWRAARPHTLAPVVTVVAVGFLLGVVQQLLRRDDRAGLVPSLAATVSAGALAAFAASWLVVALGVDQVALPVAGLAVMVASLARLVPSDPVAPWVVVGAGAVAAGLASFAVDVGPGRAAVVGLAVGVAIGLADALVRRARATLRLRWWTTGALGFAAAAPLTYVALSLTS